MPDVSTEQMLTADLRAEVQRLREENAALRAPDSPCAVASLAAHVEWLVRYLRASGAPFLHLHGTNAPDPAPVYALAVAVDGAAAGFLKVAEAFGAGIDREGEGDGRTGRAPGGFNDSAQKGGGATAMKELLGTARNIFLACNDGEEPTPMVEVVAIVCEPAWAVDGAGCLVKSRTPETIRFASSPKGLRRLAKSLCEWADETDAALGAAAPGEAPADA